MGSALDANLTVYDERGLEIAFNDDQKSSLDPRLEITVRHSGVYFLVIADAHQEGGPWHAYRLRAERKSATAVAPRS